MKNILILSDPEETPSIIEMINKSACVMKRIGRLHYEYVDDGVKYEFKSLASVDLVDDDNIFTNWIIGRKFDSVFLTRTLTTKYPTQLGKCYFPVQKMACWNYRLIKLRRDNGRV